MNGFNIGRYWNIGPQYTLYIPAPFLKPGKNDIFMFELHSAVNSIEFVANSVILFGIEKKFLMITEILKCCFSYTNDIEKVKKSTIISRIQFAINYKYNTKKFKKPNVWSNFFSL